MAKYEPTKKQTEIIKQLMQGDMLNTINIHTLRALKKHGIIENYIVGSISADEYHRRVRACEALPDDTAWYIRLTPDGLQLAESLFGSNEPDPDDSEPLPVADTPEIVQLTKRSKAVKVADMTAAEKVAVIDETIKALHERYTRVQWHTMDDLPMPVFKNALHRATFMTWRDSNPFSDINGHAIKSAPTPRRRDKSPRVVCLPNMQRKSPEIAVTREIPKRETVLQIVSRIQTPLTSQRRRVA